MTKCNEPKITSYSGAKSSINIIFKPDWPRFEMEKLDEDFFKIIEKRVYDSLVCTSQKCKINFMGKHLKKMSTENYTKMYLEDGVNVATLNSERWSVTIAPSDSGFQQVSFVNGICTTQGGTHVDHVSSQIIQGVIDEMGKKIQLKPQFIKNTMFIFVKSTIENPTFSSQVKSQCTIKASSFGSTFIPTKTYIKNILKTGIQDEILAVSKFREQKELKKTDGIRKTKINIPKLDDAHKAGTIDSINCTIIFTEGDSAKTLAVAGLSVVGRDRYGVFPLRGKCKNVRDASVNQLLSNQEFNDIKKIIGLRQEKVYTSLNELRYGRLMIMTDADDDGSHIKGLIINIFECFWPSLLELGFIVSMVTPRVKATSGKKQLSFFTDSKFKEWYSQNQSGWTIKYYKGLGTSTSKEAHEYFKNVSGLTVKFDADENSHNSLLLAFDKSLADNRKHWLLESSKSSPVDLEVNYGYISNLSVTDFIRKDMVNFSLADLKRSIASLVDGYKPSQRKVMYACFKRNITKEMKVAQLAAYVAEVTSYHHGEVSLADTIVKLAHDYVGSNNINFLHPAGQFGTRLQGGKDASQTRYINTHLTPNARKIFDPEDDAILEYLIDDGKSIEPKFFVPIIPSVLINGTEGIGTGFSTYIPSFNPDEIKQNILNILQGKDINQMIPYYKGFKGTIIQTETSPQSWLITGVWKVGASGKITVTELPVGRWTEDYKEYLETLIEKKIISDYVNNSTTEDVLFDIINYSGDSIEKDLKLTKVIHTSNMHLFHPVKGIQKYNTAEEILVDFVEIRLAHYKLRKTHLINKYSKIELELRNKSNFVRQVVEDEIIIFKRKKVDLETELESLMYDKVDDKYDYLLNIKTYEYTQESIDELNKQHTEVTNKLTTIKSITHINMWKTDILKC